MKQNTIRYLGFRNTDHERLHRFIERYEPHVPNDDAMLLQMAYGHPLVCPLWSLGVRIGLGRN